MSVSALKYESGIWLSFIHSRFLAAMHGKHIIYPLTDVIACRAFAASVTETMTRLRNADSRLPPTALILTMIMVCEEQVSGSRPVARTEHSIPLAFAYEMLDRLRAEVSVTSDFALDQVGRIITEAGTETDATRVRRAYLTFRRRIEGAFSEQDLITLVTSIWESRFPLSQHLLADELFRRAA